MVGQRKRKIKKMPLIKNLHINKNTATRKFSDKQEKAVAKAVGGRKVAGSGNGSFQKGDVNADNWIYECKTQTKHKKSFTIKKEWFIQNINEAYRMGKKYSAVVFNFGPDEENYYILDENTFLEMKNYLK